MSMEHHYSVESFKHGLHAAYSSSIDWSKFHQHNDEIELAFHPIGNVVYRFGGRTEEFSSMETFLYWGAIPHQAIMVNPGDVCYFLTIPVSLFVQMELPHNFTQEIFSGQLFRETDAATRAMDLQFFEMWKGMEQSESPYAQSCILYWVEFRLACFLDNQQKHRVKGHKSMDGLSNSIDLSKKTSYVKVKKDKGIENMYRYITSNYLKQLTVRDVADYAGLNTNYANTLFRENTGLSIGRFITMLRIYKSQSLLLTTDLKVIDIALDSGFQSLGNFYKMFTSNVGESPSKYRSRHTPNISLVEIEE